MNIKKMPLAERIRRLKTGYTAHPEYTVAIIRKWADTPIIEYFATEGDENAEKERATLRSILNISEQQEKDMTYRDVAVLINRIRNQPGQDHRLTDEAMILLATPMIGCNAKIEKAREAKNAKNTA